LALKELTDAIEVVKADRAKIQQEIDDSMSDPETKAKLQTQRTELNQLKATKGALITEKKAMRAQLDAAKNQTDKLIKDKKDSRSNVRFSTIKEIEDEISKLNRIQETTTMTLQEEKKLIKEMEQLQASKKFVAEIKNKDGALDNVKEQRKTIGQRISAKDKEIDEVSEKINAIMDALKEINEGEGKKRDALQGLFKKRDDLRKQVTDKLKEKDAMRDNFREMSNKFYNFSRALRAQKKASYEDEKKAREEEHQTYLAKVAEEDAKKIPYEEEQALCDFLSGYLERTYLGGGADKAEDEKKADVVAVANDPFAGMVPTVKVEEEFFGKGKGKKKRNRAKKQDSLAAGPFILSADSFEQFGLLGLAPPTSVDQVESIVKKLKEKKEWYKEQPRGSVPTAQEIRKASEKAAAKIQREDPPVAKNGGKSNGFSLSNDDFAPLGVGVVSSSVNISSWGKAAPAPISTENPTPAGAAAAAAAEEAS
jgi:uncharacterized coiled-coil DUF342 family protein